MAFVRILLLTVILVFTNMSSALAHHSMIATFSTEKTTTIQGAVTAFKFKNPHVLIYLDVTDENNVLNNWMAEGHAATGWRRANWTKDTIKKGQVLRVSGAATHDGSPMVWLDTMELIDEKSGAVIATLNSREDPELALSGKVASVSTVKTKVVKFLPAKLSSGDPNFTGTTRTEPALRTWKGGPDGNDDPMPYNEKGKLAAAAWDIKNDPQVFCDPPGVVRQSGYTPYGKLIKQYPDHITIEYEEYGTKRAVFFGDELPPSGVASHMGDSVARYEGDTLVIETVNALPNASGHRGKPLTGNIHVKEVFSRTDNPEFGTVLKTITTVTDPEYLTEPWSVERVTLYDDDYEFIENECVPPIRARPANVWQDYKQ